jgi:hypothetical protein
MISKTKPTSPHPDRYIVQVISPILIAQYPFANVMSTICIHNNLRD